MKKMFVWMGLIALFFTLFSGATTCYTGECLENTNCTFQEFATYREGVNETPLTGANITFQVWNNTGLIKIAMNMVEVGGGYYNGTTNLTRGVYEARINATYGNVTAASTANLQVVPACVPFQVEASVGMDFVLWAFFLVIGLALTVWGINGKSQFYPVMGGMIIVLCALTLMANGIEVNYLTVTDTWTRYFFALIIVGIGAVSMFKGATTKAGS